MLHLLFDSAGKVYKTEDNTDKLTIAFERNSTLGKSDLDDVRTNIVTSISGGSIDIPIELKP